MSRQNSQKWNAIMIILQIFCNAQIIAAKENYCYVTEYTNTAWNDSRPDFTVNMTFSDQGSMSSVTRVSREIQSPIAKLTVSIKDGKNRISTLYNVTTRLCDVNNMMKKIPMLDQVFQTATKQGNYSFDCPMAPGLYTMDNIRFSSRNPMLAMMYRPKSRYTFVGGLFEETKNKTLLPLSTYNIGLKLVKKSCK